MFSEIFVCPQGVSVQGVSVWVFLSKGLCPGRWGGLCLEGDYSVQGDPLSGGGGSVTETPCTVKSRQYASYWNTFLLN